MSVLANRQGAATGLRNGRLNPPRGVIDAGVSQGATYSLMTGSQIEFWT